MARVTGIARRRTGLALGRVTGIKAARRFTVRPRGYAYRTLPASVRLLPPAMPPLPPPTGWPGTAPEWVVYFFLTAIQHWRNGDEFEYVPRLDVPGSVKGTLAPDFLIRNREPWLAIEVQGLRWHLGRPDLVADAQARRVRLMSAGFDVVYLWEDDLLSSRWRYVCDQALLGFEVRQRPAGY